VSERELLAAMRAAPDDPAPRLIYADHLLAHGDLRGELIILDELDRAGAAMSVDQLDRLLELASIHGFPKVPDDPCATIFGWTGGGSHPTQYEYEGGGHYYYLRWRYDFSIDVDNVTVFEEEIATLTTNEWTFRETTVILSIVSDAIAPAVHSPSSRFPTSAASASIRDFTPAEHRSTIPSAGSKHATMVAGTDVGFGARACWAARHRSARPSAARAASPA
jgi:uncharacterized protein (TIGR02996 family)